MSTPRKCANMACNCLVLDKKKYCSDHCEGIGSRMEIMCLCGHSECDDAVVVPGAVHDLDAQPDRNTPRGPAPRF
jgi:hypothetical protein